MISAFRDSSSTRGSEFQPGATDRDGHRMTEGEKTDEKRGQKKNKNEQQPNEPAPMLLIVRAVKPWPNGTPNTSQVTKSKLASAGGQTIPPSRARLQETIQLSEYDRLATYNNKTTWQELAEVAKR